ncbi:MAG: heme ABC exporter ATP-binding protein CcmA [Tateyamaria sp.]|jgi:heme exporter protein A|nr:heme ABC exporter ATP-binding protein CcmA [Tateyamaria sp.]MBT5301595.1 heme ABC exporter ATP-binding protein CcmA [Tateyamaria sp.]MBT6268696.1 heme ABC exporter ATP-binding protein CcmA [Tateyamaria sp.]MBT6343063.1 heme ABC exporter ATP-binding protein CcmA [Tateyamaria sp.]MBT7448278.1 heme ABC exporter ATP-binding protein CcmA [Tateyamaria sp.]
MILTVSNLTVARGGVAILAGINFVMVSGTALVVRGPNGSGKTSLLRTIAGLQPQMSGQITGAEDRIAYAAHLDGLKAAMSVAENLEFWSSVFGGPSIQPALNAFNLNSLASRRAGHLSAGQKRRLGLARLMVTERPLWVLDEPTVSLDAVSVSIFISALESHLANGGMALISTHIDLGLDAEVLDMTPFKDLAANVETSDQAFL